MVRFESGAAATYFAGHAPLEFAERRWRKRGMPVR